jgi:hypothetical protein
MTSQEFNNKYEAYLEKGHYGLAIDIPEVTEYLDEKFQEFIQVPGFSYSQIKMKWSSSRFYCEPREIDSTAVESRIDEIVREYEETFGK